MNVKKQNSNEVILAGDAVGGELVSFQGSHCIVTQNQDDEGNVAIVDIEDGYMEYVSPETEFDVVKHILVLDPSEDTRKFLALDEKPEWTSVADLVVAGAPIVMEKEIELEKEKDSDVLNITLSPDKKKKKKNKNKNKDFQTI